MSPPDFFSIDYVINPWMDPTAWHHDAAQLASDAKAGWREMKALYEKLGATVEVQRPKAGLPDLVFTANSAVVLNGTALLARFRFPERQGEEKENMAFFQRLRSHYAVQRILTMPEGIFFEGAGDAIWDETRQAFWTGYGPRSSLKASAVIAKVYGKPVHPLKLVDPRFYHLDTCLCVLPRGEALHFPLAFNAEGLARLKTEFGDGLIAVPEADALKLAANAFPITENDVVFGSCGPDLAAQLAERGYKVHRVNLGSFARSGGSAFCLTLRLDARSQ